MGMQLQDHGHSNCQVPAVTIGCRAKHSCQTLCCWNHKLCSIDCACLMSHEQGDAYLEHLVLVLLTRCPDVSLVIRKTCLITSACPPSWGSPVLRERSTSRDEACETPAIHNAVYSLPWTYWIVVQHFLIAAACRCRLASSGWKLSCGNTHMGSATNGVTA